MGSSMLFNCAGCCGLGRRPPPSPTQTRCLAFTGAWVRRMTDEVDDSCVHYERVFRSSDIDHCSVGVARVAVRYVLGVRIMRIELLTEDRQHVAPLMLYKRKRVPRVFMPLDDPTSSSMTAPSRGIMLALDEVYLDFKANWRSVYSPPRPSSTVRWSSGDRP